MDNQHQKIKGYRELSQEEIDLMNKIKSMAEQVRVLVAEMVAAEWDRFESNPSKYEAIFGDFGEHLEWMNSATKDLQLGFMQLTRAVAKPTTF